MRLFQTYGGIRPAGAPFRAPQGTPRFARRVAPPGQRRGGLSGYTGNFPLPDGSAGSPIWRYDEQTVWGGGPGSGGGVMAPPANSGVSDGLQAGTGVSFPFGETDRLWSNPTTFATVPINAATKANVPVLSLNFQRNCLVVQNNSTATAPDTTPVFYIGFNVQPAVGFGLALAAGVGVILDIICPRDSIYVVFGPFVNGGATEVTAGVAIQGTYSPPLLPPS